MTKPFFTKDTPVNDDSLNVIARIPTKQLLDVATKGFFKKLTDADYMRVAVLLAEKGDNEGGCPIGGVIIDNKTRLIVGKGHNTLEQEGHPYNHGETSAARDAGRHDFSLTTMFTTLTPCDICTTMVYMREFNRLVIGNTLGTDNIENENKLRDKGITVDILEDQKGIEIYAAYAEKKPGQNTEDWKGVAAAKREVPGYKINSGM